MFAKQAGGALIADRRRGHWRLGRQGRVRLLLDTPALLWWLAGSRRLSPNACSAVEDDANDVLERGHRLGDRREAPTRQAAATRNHPRRGSAAGRHVVRDLRHG